MKESVIYQDILQKGKKIGKKRGEKLGLQKGQAKIIIRFLTRSLGNIPEEIEAKIRSFSVSQLNELAIAQLDFTSVDDVMNWLSQSEN